MGLLFKSNAVTSNWNVFEFNSEVWLFVDWVPHLIHVFQYENDLAELVQLFE